MASKKSKITNKTSENDEIEPSVEAVSAPAKKSPKTTKTSKTAPTKAKSTQSEPTTMEELLAQTGYKLSGIKRGTTTDGTIVFVSPKQVRVDIGGKTEAVVHDRELSLVNDLAEEFSVGTRVNVYIVSPENDQGQPVVSLRQAAFTRRWELLGDKQKTEEVIPVLVTDVARGGFLIQGFGIRGFLPFSQTEQELVELREKATGRKVKVKVLEVDKDANRFVVSQRFEGQEGELGRQMDALKKVKEGKVYEAEISGVVNFGAFAKVKIVTDAPPPEGLIHISEIAWEKVEDPRNHLKEGQKVKVKLINLDQKSGRLTLSLKQLKPDPWQEVAKAFEAGQHITGEVTRVSAYGFFVRLVPGIEGLIHISKISPGEEPKVGDEINCVVDEVVVDKRKISLSVMATSKPIGYR